MIEITVTLLAKFRIARHSIASVRTESKLKIAVISVAALAIYAGLLFAFLKGFGWLIDFGGKMPEMGRGIGAIVMSRLLGVLTLVIFFMLIFSNILVSFSTLYRSREVAYLLQAPMSFRAFFVARFLECVAMSSWALAFLGSPLIIAYGVATHAPIVFYLAAVVFFLPYVALPAALGSMITLVLARIFPRLRMRTIVLLGILSVCVFFLFARQSLSATKLSEDTILPAILDVTTQTQSPFLPSYWTSRGILAATELNYGECLFNLLLLVANSLMALWLAAQLAQRIFYRGWSSLAGSERTRILPPGKGILGRLDAFTKAIPNPAHALIVKDIKLFWRDATQWSQFVIFFGIMGVYIANLRNTSNYYQQQEFWKSWIACLNTGACTLILATLTSRFVFPLVSLEGRRVWIIGLAPVPFERVVWQKFWLSLATTSFFTVGLAILSGITLQLAPIYFSLTVYSVIVTNFGLTGLAIGLGTLYPNFEEDNPARIVSGMGGTLNFLLSVAYISLIVGAQTFLLQWRVMRLFTSDLNFYIGLASVVAFMTVLSLASTVLPVRLGLRNLRRAEF